MEPKVALPGKPWSWCMEFPDAFTDRCAAPALLAKGFHHAHISVGNTYGSPGAMKHLEAFHAEVVRRGLAPKAALIGISRGCLYAHRFAAEHPEKVSVIYGDAGVCDIKSWPGGKGKGQEKPRRIGHPCKSCMAFRTKPLHFRGEAGLGTCLCRSQKQRSC